VYFAAGRRPPLGLGNSFGQELKVDPALATVLRVVSEQQIDDWIRAGHFDAIVLEQGDSRLRRFGSLQGEAGYAVIPTGTEKFTFFLRRPPQVVSPPAAQNIP
jgi:hypothetical protein